MPFANITTVTVFILRGFPGLQASYYGYVAMLLLIMYLTTVAGNCLILIIVAIERRLQKPMYFIYCKMAASDLIFATATLPKVIARYWAQDIIISFQSCFLQMFFVHLLGGFKSLLLMIMALDCYIAICNPLRYQAIIKTSTLISLFGICWIIAITRVVTIVGLSASLPYCNSNEILQCYCESIAVTNIACGKVKETQIVDFCLTMFVFVGPLVFIMFSYAAIIISILKVASVQRRYKAFSTCTPQLFIICLYYIPRCFLYFANLINLTLSVDIRVLIIMLYSLLPCFVNPFIYCLRTKEVKETLSRRLRVRKVVIVAGHS